MITITQIRFSKNNVVFLTKNVNYNMPIENIEAFKKSILLNHKDEPDHIDFNIARKIKTLQLSLKKQWFEMTKQGIKKEDYREINSYWANRLLIYSNKLNANRQYWEILDGVTRENWLKCISNSISIGKIVFNHYDYNTMTLGYPKSTDSSRILKLEHKGIEIGYGKPEWGAEPNKLYFIIKHGEIIE